jgi:hypothetical protein
MYKCFEGHKPKIKTLLPVYVLFWSDNNFDTERASDKRMSLLLDKRVN